MNRLSVLGTFGHTYEKAAADVHSDGSTLHTMTIGRGHVYIAPAQLICRYSPLPVALPDRSPPALH
jgi:hypothetical protein